MSRHGIVESPPPIGPHRHRALRVESSAALRERGVEEIEICECGAQREWRIVEEGGTEQVGPWGEPE